MADVQGCWTKLRQNPLLEVSGGLGVPSDRSVWTRTRKGLAKPNRDEEEKKKKAYEKGRPLGASYSKTSLHRKIEPKYVVINKDSILRTIGNENE